MADAGAHTVDLTDGELRTLRHALSHALRTIPEAGANEAQVMALIRKLRRAEKGNGEDEG